MPKKHVPGMILRNVNRRRPTTEGKDSPNQGLLVNAGILRNPTSTLDTKDGVKTTVTQTVIQGPGVTRWIQLLDGSIASQLVQVQ